MVLKQAPPGPARPGAGGALAAAWRELLLPLAVAAGLALIAVALVEGPPLEQFLYAVF